MDGIKKTLLRITAMLRTIDLNHGAHSKHFGRQPVARKLSYTVTLASPLDHTTVCVFSTDVDVRMWIALFKLGDYSRDADGFARIEMWSKTVMRARD
jgi:hypothetical protein